MCVINFVSISHDFIGYVEELSSYISACECCQCSIGNVNFPYLLFVYVKENSNNARHVISF